MRARESTTAQHGNQSIDGIGCAIGFGIGFGISDLIVRRDRVEDLNRDLEITIS